MIVVFVVDTSPSMAEPASSTNSACGSDDDIKAKGISRLDVAKMAVESLARSMDKRIMEHNRSVVLASAQAVAAGSSSAANVDVGRLEQFDEFLLLSTGLQPDLQQQQQQSSSSFISPESKLSSSSSSLAVSSTEAIAAAAEAHAACGAGGRLLVGCVEILEDKSNSQSMLDGGGGNASTGGMLPHPPDRVDFERELKRLRSPTLPTISKNANSERQSNNNNSDPNTATTFPEWAGGAVGLNAALSHGLGLLSRYRLTHGRIVEHFGMGRLPWFEHQMTKLTKGGSTSGEEPNSNIANRNESPLQPACLVLLTDGECLRLPPDKGGGSLRLQFGNMPLREFYREPFRWDQRIFILHIGDSSVPPLHQSLRALCEVTGGAYMKIHPSASSLTNILSRISPPRPNSFSVPDPLRLPSMPVPSPLNDAFNSQATRPFNVFVNGGPVCCFQSMEGGSGGEPSLHRAMIMFAGSCEQSRWIVSASNAQQSALSPIVQTPIWCIPEPFFPSKKLDALPPRPSQPLLHYSRTYHAVGSPVFDPMFVMKALHHLDQLHVSIRQLLIDAGDNPPPITNRMLQRDVYICDWLGGQESSSTSGISPPGVSSNATGAPRTQSGREHFPLCVRGAGRPTISGEGGDNILNIGILHVPHDWIRIKDIRANASKNLASLSARLSTVTLLPPDPHILIPLLIRCAEMELRILKKATESSKEKAGNRGGATAGLIKKKVNSAAAARAIHLDDNWKSDFRAYLFRLPPYYFPAIRRVLRPVLPPSATALLPDGQEPLPSLCFSRNCFLKIKNGEQAARDGNDWLRGMERDLRQRGSRSIHDVPIASAVVHPKQRNLQSEDARPISFSYGRYDPARMSEHSYKQSLRNMPPPWKCSKKDSEDEGGSGRLTSVTDILNELPASCLLPYYESRRRWIFGCTGLTTRGLHVEGVNNDGANSHHYPSSQNIDDEPLIALACVGADTTNQNSIFHMGDFKERLLWSRVPLVGYGGSNATGSAVTTSADGSPVNSVDDDVLPINFFDTKTGEFVDNIQTRSRSRFMINFGNPFQDKRGDSIVPENFGAQRPPLVGENGMVPCTPPGSPPHDAYDSSPVEDEGEAAFTGKRPASPPRSPRHSKLNDLDLRSLREGKRRKNSHPEGPPQNLPSESPETNETQVSTSTLSSKQKIQHRHPLTKSSLSQPPSRPPPPKRTAMKSGEDSTRGKHDFMQKTQPPPPPPPSALATRPPNPKDPSVAKSHKAPDQASRKPAPPKRQNSEESSSTNANTQPQQTQPNKHQINANTYLAAQLQSPDEKPKVDLPEGWMCVWSKSQKRWYFFDTKTNKSVWEWPPPGGAL